MTRYLALQTIKQEAELDRTADRRPREYLGWRLCVSSAQIIVRAMLPQQPRRLDHLDVSTMAYRAFPRRRSCCVRLTHSDIGATLNGHPLGPHISLTPSWGVAQLEFLQKILGEVYTVPPPPSRQD